MAGKVKEKLALQDCKAKHEFCSNGRQIMRKNAPKGWICKCVWTFAAISEIWQGGPPLQCIGGSREHVPVLLVLQKMRQCNFYWECARQVTPRKLQLLKEVSMTTSSEFGLWKKEMRECNFYCECAWQSWRWQVTPRWIQNLEVGSLTTSSDFGGGVSEFGGGRRREWGRGNATFTVNVLDSHEDVR